MDVRIEEIAAELGNNGVQLRVSEPGGGKALGRLWIGKNYKEVSMEQFIDWLNSH